MSSRLLAVTGQGAVLAALSNLIAQGLTAYRSTGPYSFDYTALLHMVLLSIIQTPPNYKWQMSLEHHFPGYPAKHATAEKAKVEQSVPEEMQSLSVTNTVIKFILDQTVGAVVNNLMFLVGINLLRGAGLATTVAALQKVYQTSRADQDGMSANMGTLAGLLDDAQGRIHLLALCHSDQPSRGARRATNACRKSGWSCLGRLCKSIGALVHPGLLHVLSCLGHGLVQEHTGYIIYFVAHSSRLHDSSGNVYPVLSANA